MHVEVEKERRRHWLRWLLWPLLGLLLLGGCVRGVMIPTFPNKLTLASQPGAKSGVRVVFYGQDHMVVPYVVEAVQNALRTTNIWGGLEKQLTVRVFPTHRSLEEAVLRQYSWLRAWALYHEVYLQSPRTWRMKYFDSPLSELLVHELTHVVMYQQCCSSENWRYQHIPFWFREGMASYTAKQERRRWSQERLALFVRSPTGLKVFRRPEQHLVRHQPAAYSLAHWKFVHLVKGWKVKGIRKLLHSMQRGKSFAQAFQSVFGISMGAFDQRFEKKLREASMLSRRPDLRRDPVRSTRAPWWISPGVHRCASHQP